MLRNVYEYLNFDAIDSNYSFFLILLFNVILYITYFIDNII